MAETTLSKLKKRNIETAGEPAEVRAAPVAKAESVSSVAKPSADAVARRNRRTRSPIDGRRNILTVKGLAPGMVGRWVDNDPDRVEALMEQGYEPVRHPVSVGDRGVDSGADIGAVVTRRVGGGKEAILMQIPKDWYEADQREKQKIVDDREKAIGGKKQAQGSFYGGIAVEDVVPGRAPTVRNSEEE